MRHVCSITTALPYEIESSAQAGPPMGCLELLRERCSSWALMTSISSACYTCTGHVSALGRWQSSDEVEKRSPTATVHNVLLIKSLPSPFSVYLTFFCWLSLVLMMFHVQDQTITSWFRHDLFCLDCCALHLLRPSRWTLCAATLQINLLS
jgi:hypothetical protein